MSFKLVRDVIGEPICMCGCARAWHQMFEKDGASWYEHCRNCSGCSVFRQKFEGCECGNDLGEHVFSADPHPSADKVGTRDPEYWVLYAQFQKLWGQSKDREYSKEDWKKLHNMLATFAARHK